MAVPVQFQTKKWMRTNAAARRRSRPAGLYPDDAAQQAIDLLGQRVGGEGGCIVLDNDGQVGWAQHSTDMPCAVMTSAMEQPRMWLRKADAVSAAMTQ
jgi:isoaspartyl peptidase/L-asparaginase-like protein (Ntn-hydrolase superfamily)